MTHMDIKLPGGETPTSKAEREDNRLDILFLLPVNEHKQRSPLVHLHNGLSALPSFVLGRIAFQAHGERKPCQWLGSVCPLSPSREVSLLPSFATLMDFSLKF